MCARHRSEALHEIRQRLTQDKPCRVVSTSLIEAGVDIDFPTVFRAEAGLDSIAQAAGRCNREGRRDSALSEVWVFAPDQRWSPPPELKQFAQAGRMILRHHQNDPLSLAAVHAYFRELYWQKGEHELDGHSILSKTERGQLDNIPYETMASDFRMIENAMLPIIIPYDSFARSALNALRHADKVGLIGRKLQPYLVQVPERGLQALQQAGAVQPVRPEVYGEQFMELVNPNLYDQRYGLSWDNPAFIKSEDLVI